MLCDEELRIQLRFKNKDQQDMEDDRLSNTKNGRNEQDIENQKDSNDHDVSSMPKKTVYGKFVEGHMIGGIYKLE